MSIVCVHGHTLLVDAGIYWGEVILPVFSRNCRPRFQGSIPRQAGACLYFYKLDVKTFSIL